MRKYAFFDMDETVSRGHSMIDFARFLSENGLAPAALADNVNLVWAAYTAGTVDYVSGYDRLLALLSESLAGHESAEVRRWARAFATAQPRLYDWVEPAFAFLRRNGFQIWLLSASLAPCVEAIARRAGVDHYRCTRLQIIDGRYTGRATRRVPPAQKRRWVESLRCRGDVPAFSIAVGDSSGDIDMLAAADRAFVVNAHQPDLLRLARQQGWCVTSPSSILDDLKAALAPVDDGGFVEIRPPKLPLPRAPYS